MKQKVIALFLIIVMVASALTVVGLATTTTRVDALTATTTKIATSKTHPAIGESVTFTVNLKAGTTGLSKTVKIWHYRNGLPYQDGTHKTVNGVYKFTQAFGSVGPRLYYAKFYGDSKYAPSSSSVIVYVGKPTTLTMTGVHVECAGGKCEYWLTGTLTDKTTGRPIAGATVNVARLVGSTWSYFNKGVTDSTGRYLVGFSYPTYYQAYFLGNTLYASSYSRAMWAWRP